MNETDVTEQLEELKQRLDAAITDTAEYVHYRISFKELDELCGHNPSFAVLARRARELANAVKSAYDASGEKVDRVHQDFIELVEILESVAQSIVDEDSDLLIDCVVHLEEFIKIRGRSK